MDDGTHARVRVLGVDIVDLTEADAVGLLEKLMLEDPERARCAFFVNAHTLNVACQDPEYRRVLASADCVFGDGTGVRWAARLLQGRRLLANVNGTDLVPRFLRETAGRGHRYYLLGARSGTIERAAAHASSAFPGWTLAGCHHGYVCPEDDARVVASINAARAELLLVGMGNPKQERWIDSHARTLRVGLCIGVGGLFDYWAGDLERAPGWVRRLGSEWVHLLIRQPRKTHRYLLGNPRFLARVARARWGNRKRSRRSSA